MCYSVRATSQPQGPHALISFCFTAKGQMIFSFSLAVELKQTQNNKPI